MGRIKESPSKFRALVWKFYRANGRHDLPWRKTRDPYKILVSEVMLQQTQAERVIPFYKKFIKKFPTAERLASASLAPVLQMWQGLGYNRRAKLLRNAAKELVNIPKSSYRLKLVWETLPGVGKYTARAVAAFAYNKDVVFVETNIRTAIIHHFFPRRRSVADIELVEVLAKVLPRGRAREWYSALMDYGASLKRSGVSHTTRSRHYKKQSRFTGSLREARGAVLRTLSFGSSAPGELTALFGGERRAQMRTALRMLLTEGLIQKKGERYTLAD